MHTLLQSHMANALAKGFQDATVPAQRRAAQQAVASQPVVIRRAGAPDAPALRSLAELDGTRAEREGLQSALADGGVLLAEVDGSLRAALAVRGGRPVADPFVPTAGLAELLSMRAGQLRRAA